MEQERRRHTRYEQNELELSVARPGIKGILSVNPTCECLNFSLTGLQFGSEQVFKIGERLILDLRVFDVMAEELRARVVNCESNDDGMYCTCVRFCFEEKSMQRDDINHALLRIEDRLRICNEYPLSAPIAGQSINR